METPKPQTEDRIASFLREGRALLEALQQREGAEFLDRIEAQRRSFEALRESGIEASPAEKRALQNLQAELSEAAVARLGQVRRELSRAGSARMRSLRSPEPGSASFVSTRA